MHLLASLQQALASARRTAWLRRADPIDRLVVELGENLELEIFLGSDLLAHLDPEEDAGDDAVDYLQFHVTFPFVVKRSAVSELADLILLLNTGLPLVGLGLRASDRVAYYRHVQIVLDSRIDPRAVAETIGVIERIIGQYRPVLEQVASGEKSFREVLADA